MAVTSFSGESLENFIEHLSLPDSFAREVLHSIEDCQKFYINFYGRNHHVTDDLMDYRENKIQNSDITIDIFLKMCNGDILNAFETTFLQTFTVSDMALINRAIKNGETSLEEIYYGFKESPNQRIMKKIL